MVRGHPLTSYSLGPRGRLTVGRRELCYGPLRVLRARGLALLSSLQLLRVAAFSEASGRRGRCRSTPTSPRSSSGSPHWMSARPRWAAARGCQDPPASGCRRSAPFHDDRRAAGAGRLAGRARRDPGGDEATSDYWRAPFYLLEDRFE